FTRIGSGDRLAQGESTFMVEMRETSKILKSATAKSLIILDEVGRGTSTYDGLSIAWSVIEYLAGKSSKVLFATHYFELTHLAAQFEKIKNYHVEAKEWQETVLFLHKIEPGPADRSYGIHVAQLAGLPSSVIQRAKKILQRLEQEHSSVLESRGQVQPELF
ncbi:MAG: DNA mismatch repair protein MutS, partial [Elusimicrobia bacterium]|nr:DNA mismatch repair protein MutS [Elusimicrobiota bacterium]